MEMHNQLVKRHSTGWRGLSALGLAHDYLSPARYWCSVVFACAPILLEVQGDVKRGVL
jgi:hypothetical protein